MQSRQHQPSTQQSNVAPVPLTLWSQLPPSNQRQLAHLVADLIRRVRAAAQDKENDHEC